MNEAVESVSAFFPCYNDEATIGTIVETTAATLNRELGGTLKPLPVGPSLLVYLDQAKRLEFLRQWQQAIGTK